MARTPKSSRDLVYKRSLLRYPTQVNISAMIEELRQELVQIDRAILSLQQLAMGQGKRRGRPPKWLKDVQAPEPRKRGRPPGKKSKTV